MPIDSSDLCRFSQEVVNDNAPEVALRASGSRAYYAAYHSLLWLAEKLPASSKDDPRAHHIGHRELQRRIAEWNTSAVHPDLARLTVLKGQISLALEGSRKFREACDYQLDEQISINEARAQIERARRILRHSKQLYLTVNPERDPESDECEVV